MTEVEEYKSVVWWKYISSSKYSDEQITAGVMGSSCFVTCILVKQANSLINQPCCWWYCYECAKIGLLRHRFNLNSQAARMLIERLRSAIITRYFVSYMMHISSQGGVSFVSQQNCFTSLWNPESSWLNLGWWLGEMFIEIFPGFPFS